MKSSKEQTEVADWISLNTTFNTPERNGAIRMACFLLKRADRVRGNQKTFDRTNFNAQIETFDDRFDPSCQK